MNATQKNSDDEIARLAALITENFEDQLAKVVEAIDSRIQCAVTPLRASIESLEASNATIQLAVKESNKSVQQLDKAIGNVKHQVHAIKSMSTDNYMTPRTLRTTLTALDTRVGKLEAAV